MMNRVTEAAFLRRVVMATGVLMLATAVFVICYYAVPVLLLLFLALLLAVFIRGLADFVQKFTGWRFRWSMITVLGAIAGLFAVAVLLLAPGAIARISGVLEQLPEVRHRIEQYGWAALLYHVPGMQELLSGHLNIWERFTKSFSFSETFGPLISLGLVVIIGLYLAAGPQPYVEGAVALCPAANREDCRAVLLAMGETLRWWLIGQVAGMLFIGVVVSIGLLLIGVPLWIALGIFAGLMAFVPNVGYFLSIAPAILLAVLQSPLAAFGVLVLYTGAHWGNDYILVPLVQRRTVELPPALTISMQLVLGFLLGGIGLLIATPLVAVLVVLVKMTYLRQPAAGE